MVDSQTIVQQTAYLVFNPIRFDSFAAFFSLFCIGSGFRLKIRPP